MRIVQVVTLISTGGAFGGPDVLGISPGTPNPYDPRPRIGHWIPPSSWSRTMEVVSLHRDDPVRSPALGGPHAAVTRQESLSEVM